MTDDIAMKALSGTPADLALQALAAGCDVALYCSGEFAPTADLLAALPAAHRRSRGPHGSRPGARRRGAAAARRSRSRSRTGSAAGVSNLILQLALAVIPAILAITLHEAAHGYAALALGDDTAKQAGRLSLNPLRHVDRVGTIILPGFLLIFQLLTVGRVLFMFGWAKPVPVSAWKFKDPRRGMALVAVAGPAMNFFLAWVGALLLPGPMPSSAAAWIIWTPRSRSIPSSACSCSTSC